MAKQDYIFTSESVSEGHPDKVCDIISDSVLDLYLSKFPESRVACETLVTTNTVVIAGEVRGPEIKSDEIEKLIRSRVKDIGYEQEGFHWKNLKFTNYLHSQSQDIAVGVDSVGKSTYWVNDQQKNEAADVAGGRVALSRRSPGQATFIAGDAPPVELKVGATFNRATGETTDGLANGEIRVRRSAPGK